MTITQTSPDGGPGNTARADQRGSFNEMTITQSGQNNIGQVQQSPGQTSSTATVSQSGRANTGLITQRRGTGNAATIDQLTTGRGNLADIYQGDGAVSDNNTSRATQRGNQNTARLDVLGNGNIADLTQTGRGNVIQGIAGQSPFAAYAGQYGNTNTLTVNQTSDIAGPGNTANVLQQGNGNALVITQGPIALP